MRILAFLVLGFGIALASGGMYFVSETLRQQQASPITTDYVTILVANQRLAQGDALQADQLKYISLPRQAVPQGAYTSMTALFGDLGDRQRFVARSFEPGEPILEGKLKNYDRNSVIGPGERIVSIPIDAVSGVSGFVGAGDHVDILLTHTDTDGQLTNQVILENVLVYAVDQRFATEAATPRTGRTVTVVVTTHDAQLLNVAQAKGHLSLILRGDVDTDNGGPLSPFKEDDLDDSTEPTVVSKKYVWMRRGGVLEKVFLE